MTITYRAGTPADAVGLAEMMRASAAIAFRVVYPAFPRDSEPPSVEDLAPGWVGITVVAELDGEIIGGGIVGEDPTVPSGWLIDRLYVHPDHWSSGVGAEILPRLVAAARSAGATSINLWALEISDGSRRFYERHGWRLVPGRTAPNEGSDVLDVLYQLDSADDAFAG
ncbi:MAG: GNAT family N-acetyltransferase [Actinomycetota bacterium]